MNRTGTDDLEDLRSLRLDSATQKVLLEAQTECTVIFSNEDGWPSGVIMTYLHMDGCFWLTTVEGRFQVHGIERDPRVSLVFSNAGTELSGRRMLSIRGTAVFHQDTATKQRVLTAFAEHHQPDDPQAFLRLLDSPKRLVMQVFPTAIAVSHDSTKMPGNGRGGTKRS